MPSEDIGLTTTMVIESTCHGYILLKDGQPVVSRPPLATQYPSPSSTHISFDAESHTYTFPLRGGVEASYSTTGMMNTFSGGFDSTRVAMQCANNSVPEARKLCKEWEMSGPRGTAAHLVAELYCNFLAKRLPESTQPTDDDDIRAAILRKVGTEVLTVEQMSNTYRQIKHAMEDFSRQGWWPLATEHPVSNHSAESSALLAGMVDLIMWRPDDGRVLVVDFKTTTKTSPPSSGRVRSDDGNPMAGYGDGKLDRWRMQVNFYAAALTSREENIICAPRPLVTPNPSLEWTLWDRPCDARIREVGCAVLCLSYNDPGIPTHTLVPLSWPDGVTAVALLAEFEKRARLPRIPPGLTCGTIITEARHVLECGRATGGALQMARWTVPSKMPSRAGESWKTRIHRDDIGHPVNGISEVAEGGKYVTAIPLTSTAVGKQVNCELMEVQVLAAVVACVAHRVAQGDTEAYADQAELHVRRHEFSPHGEVGMMQILMGRMATCPSAIRFRPRTRMQTCPSCSGEMHIVVRGTPLEIATGFAALEIASYNRETFAMHLSVTTRAGRRGETTGLASVAAAAIARGGTGCFSI
jgi:hypothetical protein